MELTLADDVRRWPDGGSEYRRSGKLYRLDTDGLLMVDLKTDDLSVKQWPMPVGELKFVDKNNAVVLTEEGLLVYSLGEDGVEMTTLGEEFHAVYAWSQILVGRFYRDHSIIGVATKHADEPVEFYGITNDQVMKLELAELDDVLGSADTKVHLVEMAKGGQQHVVLRHRGGVREYVFNNDLGVDVVRDVPRAGWTGEDDALYFPHITSSSRSDVLQLNASGLFLFDESGAKSYYHPIFSRGNGWTEEFQRSILFEDLDYDEKDEMVFMGPSGVGVLTWDESEEDLLTEVDSVGLPRGRLLHASPEAMFIVIQRNLRKVNIEKIEIVESVPMPTNPTLVPPRTSPIIPTRRSIQETHKVQLKNQLDHSFLMNAVDGTTGKVKFTLPLVQIQNSMLELSLDYDEGVVDVERGLAWGWQLPGSYVIVDHRGSVFPEDHVFYIVFQGVPLQLERDEFQFKVKEVEHISVELKEDVWLVLNKETKASYQFGGVNTRYDVKWDDWMGPGRANDVQRQRRVAVEWHLLRASDGNGGTIQYQYDKLEVKLPGSIHSYTKEMNLANISDNHGNTLSFQYAEKSDVTNPSIVDSHGILKTSFTYNRYLIGYTLKTETYTQTVGFKYDVRKGMRLLTAIKQDKEELIQFQYRENRESYTMEKGKLVNGVEVEFQYDMLGKVGRLENNIGQRVSYEGNYKVDYADVIFVSHLTKAGQVSLRSFNKDNLRETGDRFPLLGYNGVEDYWTVLTEDFFGFLLSHVSDIELCLFGKKKEGWNTQPECFRHDARSLLRVGTGFFVILTDTAVEVIEWDEEIKKAKTLTIHSKRKPDHLLMAVSGRRIALYDDKTLRLCHKPKQWVCNVVKEIPGFIKTSKQILDKFNLTAESSDNYLNFLKMHMLSFNNNLLILNNWSLSETQLSSNLNLFVVGKNHGITFSNQQTIKQDKIVTVIDEKFVIKDGNQNKYYIGYGLINGKFLYKVKKVEKESGPIATNKEIEDQIRKGDISNILLDMSKYEMKVIENGVVVGGEKVEYTGDGWVTVKSQKDEEILLGTEFILTENCKMFQQEDGRKVGNVVYDFQVKFLNQTVIQYPSYIASQLPGESVKVVRFTEDGKKVKSEHTLLSGERLSQWTGMQHLVTEEGINQKHLNIRLFSEIHLFPNSVVARLVTRLDKTTERVVGFGYDVKSSKTLGGIVVYNKIQMIPGGNKKYGWIEDKGTTKTVYDGSGNVLRVLEDEKEKEDKKKEKERDENVLYDKTGKQKIAEFTLLHVMDEEVSYFGFEDYEVNKIGQIEAKTDRTWDFKSTNVQRNDFSLTGKNILRLLQETEKLSGKFKVNYENVYVAACWVRLNKEASLGESIPILSVTLSLGQGGKGEAVQLLGKAKLRKGPWHYLEIVLDVMDLLPMLTNEVQAKGDVIAEVVVRPVGSDAVSVDHIRFHPFESRFKGCTYNERGQVLETITENGLVKRNVYDEYGRNVASIDEINQLEKLQSYTKGNGLKSELKFIPETGFYEDFDPKAFTGRWRISDGRNWAIAPHVLRHSLNSEDKLWLVAKDIDISSFGVRFLYNLSSNQARIRVKDTEIIQSSLATKIIHNGMEVMTVASQGEFILVEDGGRRFVWVDGVLCVDAMASSSRGEFIVKGEVILSHVVVMSSPKITIAYLNKLKEKVQELQYEGPQTVVVREQLRDELGREDIVTKWVRTGPQNGKLLLYRSNFVTNKNPKEIGSVWTTDILQGEINQWDRDSEGHGFTRSRYRDNPLDEICEEGLPGEQFSVTGVFSKKISFQHDVTFLYNLYPTNKNYTHIVEHKPGDVQNIMVVNDKKLKVATYNHIPNRLDVFASYDYDSKGNLIKVLPPMYHEKARTFFKFSGQPLTKEEEMLEQSLGLHMTYDEKGNLLSKYSCDTGKVEYLHEDGFLKYIVHSVPGQGIKDVIVFKYDVSGRVKSTELLKESVITKEQLLQGNRTFKTEPYQAIIYNDRETEPFLRGRVQRIATLNGDDAIIEESTLDGEGQVVTKRLILPVKDNETVEIVINKKYKRDILNEVEYPAEVNGVPLTLQLQHDKRGKLTGINIKGSTQNLLDFTYNAEGHVVTETHLAGSRYSVERTFKYNIPGFLSVIDDQFLRENLYYTDRSYGGHGYGDGTVTRTQFKAKWHDKTDSEAIKLKPHSFQSESVSNSTSKQCFEMLKEHGYIDENNHQNKLLYTQQATTLPILCTSGIIGRQIQLDLGTKGFPVSYGHIYDYGNHQELTKAKYFLGENIPEPLQPNSFHKEIPSISENVSREIWTSLHKAGYIVQDIGKATNLVQAKRGKQKQSLIRASLFKDLQATNPRLLGFVLGVSQLLTDFFVKGKMITDAEFNDHCLKWIRKSTDRQNDCKSIWRVLQQGNYIAKPLDGALDNLVNQHKQHASKIVDVLSRHIAQELGEAEFDVESYEIDINGNHRKFNTGFEHFELLYRENSNQIDTVHIRSSSKPLNQKFTFNYDHRGNVVQALHKKIRLITYDKVANRPSKVVLTDGTSVSFAYDAQGERVLKRVADSQGTTLQETHYVRDERARCLVERRMTFAGHRQPDVRITSYLYGPRGLVGFFRRNEFYSVLTDHEGSVRLVAKYGEVVAAYDYLPYGKLMREYASFPDADVSYRFTGQEWDEELQLYNFHVRMYDPDIGRFYQIDPKGQYFSPYKYAGNSPISIVDPDGQFAFLIAVAIGAIVGAYLGGAAANNDFRFWKWDWKNPKTYGGMILGGIGGALIPGGAVASVGALTSVGVSTGVAIAITGGTGAVFGYFNMAAANNDWNPGKWNWKSPVTWNAAFVGVGGGVSVIGGISSIKQIFVQLSRKGKILFGLASVGSGGALITYGGISNNWDFTKPGMWNSILNSMVAATDIPLFFYGAGKFLTKNGRLIWGKVGEINTLRSRYALEGRFHGDIFNRVHLQMKEVMGMEAFRDILRASGKVTGAVVGTAASVYLVGSTANGKWSGWDNSADSYMAVLNGVLTSGMMGSVSRKLYKKVQAGMKHKDMVQADAFQIEAKKAATIVMEYYDTLVKQKKFDPKSSEYSIQSQNLLDPQNPKIPNKALSVGIKDDHIVVAASTSKAPGVVAVFKKGHVTKEDMTIIVLQKNTEIGGQPIVLHGDDSVARTTQLMIEAKQTAIRKDNTRLFDESQGTMQNKLEKTNIPKEVLESVLRDLRAEVAETGYAHRQKIKEFVSERYFENDPALQNLRIEVDTTENMVNSLKQQKKTIKTKEEARSVGERLKEMSKSLTSKRKELETQTRKLDHGINTSIKDIYREIAPLEQKLTLWCSTNCAEPHVITALARWKDGHLPKLPQLPKKPWYRRLLAKNDIKYLSTYKLDFGPDGTSNVAELIGFQRCDNCLVTTANVRHVPTDDGWAQLLQSQLQKVETTKAGLQKVQNRLGFLLPIQALGNWTRIKEDEPKRNKREIPNQLNFTEKVYQGFNNLLSTLNDTFQPTFTPSASFDLNASLLFLDTLVRRKTGKKFVGKNENISENTARLQAMEITDKLEEVLGEVLDNPEEAIDFVEIQRTVCKLIMSGERHEIPNALSSHLDLLHGVDKLNFERLLDEVMFSNPGHVNYTYVSPCLGSNGTCDFAFENVEAKLLT